MLSFLPSNGARVAAILLCAMTSNEVRAQQPSSTVEVRGSVTLVSDYRFRGISFSDGDPALQAEMEAELKGWFAGAWASTTRFDGRDGVEVEFYAGRRWTLGRTEFSLAGHAYVEPSRGEPTYYEAEAAISRNLGPVTTELEVYFAPSQHRIGDTLYVALGAELPIPGSDFALRGHVGRDSLFGSKVDWEAGAIWRRDRMEIAGSLIGVWAQAGPFPGAGTGVVVSATRTW